MKYTVNSQITFNKVDLNGITKASCILELMEDAANMQMKIYSPSIEELRSKRNQAFLLSKVCLKYHTPIHTYDNISSSTWACPSSGLIFRRNFSIKRGGKTVADAETVWALVDITDKHLVRVSDYRCGFDTDDEVLEGDYNLRPRIPEKDSLVKLGEYTVSYGDIDYNGHMNNTKYADLVCNFAGILDMRISELCISFQNEAPLGEVLSCYGYHDGDTFCFRSLRADGKVNIDAIVKFSKIGDADLPDIDSFEK